MGITAFVSGAEELASLAVIGTLRPTEQRRANYQIGKPEPTVQINSLGDDDFLEKANRVALQPGVA
ncbi:MAG: hypothetical protein ABI625_24885, partial [bacterium]